MPTPDPATQARSPRKTVDWEAVSLRYRTGTESLRTIAADFGITEGAIRQRAKKEDWTRDLSARVKQATDQALLRKGTTQDVRTERQAVAVEAEMRSDVILRERKDIAVASRLTADMLEELGTATEKKLPLAKRAPILKQLSESLRIQIGLERQAFGITGDPADDPEHPANVAAQAAAAAAAGTVRHMSDMERAVRLARALSASPDLAAALTTKADA